MYKQFIDFVKSIYGTQDFIPLHPPLFQGKEKEYLIDCIDSTFVSYVGKYVTKFEEMTAEFTGAKYAVAVVNGTAALQIALQVAGVKHGEEVITQPLTFVATANAISHCGANPVFVDVDLDTLGMSPEKLEEWLKHNTKPSKLSKHSQHSQHFSKPINQSTNRPISAIVPMHTFGFPCRINEIIEVANKYNIPVIEDSAESLGSYFNGKHTGTFGLAGILSYNGNKTITTGGGGMIITDDEEFAKKAKHITTTAKLPHKYEYVHDQIAYNYRLTNLNAAIGVAQMEQLDKFIENKRQTAKMYQEFFNGSDIKFFDEPQNTKSNFWLNTILLKDLKERNEFLEYTNDNGVMTRPIWRLMNKLKMYKNCQCGNLDNAEWLEERAVNIPSGVRITL
jgi:aminotransferase in exopolysaccharide biosynthesis